MADLAAPIFAAYYADRLLFERRKRQQSLLALKSAVRPLRVPPFAA